MRELFFAALMSAVMGLNVALGIHFGPWTLYLGGLFTGGMLGLWAGKHAAADGEHTA